MQMSIYTIIMYKCQNIFISRRFGSNRNITRGERNVLFLIYIYIYSYTYIYIYIYIHIYTYIYNTYI